MFEFPLDDIYQMIYSFHEEFALWILIFGVIFGFVLSFVVGANDSANSWGTPVGAGTVSFGVAVLCGSVMELLGAALLSAGVVRTIAGLPAGEWCLMLGMLSSLMASQAWHLAAVTSPGLITFII